MKRLLTGLQPTGIIHLGNYIGAIKQMRENQGKYDSYIFVADLHSITIPQDAEKLKQNIKSLIALYLACGIDPKQNTFYLQSDIEYIPCISWLLECNAYYGELSRMTQFKDKSQKSQNFTSGLLTYPVLMSADILAVDTDFVPVGIDQKQHVELARNIAERFNNKYGKTFVVPEPLITEVGTKIMDLQDPSKKMSKSAENQKGVLNLLDEEKVLRKKIMSATTDSEMSVKFDPENKKGISNLINIYSAITGKAIKEIEKEFEGSNYGNFKTKVADVVCEQVGKIQEKYNQYLNSDEIDKILDEGKEKLISLTKAKYQEMRSKIGVIR